MKKHFLYLFFMLLLSACTETPKNTSSNEKQPSKQQETTTPPKQLATAKQLIADTPTDKINQANAKSIFNRNCAMCHGMKGDLSINGSKKLNITNTSLEQRVAQIYFGKGAMTPFKGVMKNEDIIAVAQYIDEFK